MASTVKFDPPGVEGLVAAGTSVAAAAERLGVPIELACGGAGECTSCAVRMLDNPFALTEITESERRMLGDERIAEGVRLACQAHVRSGDCTARVISAPSGADEEPPPTAGATRERILEEVAQLPVTDRLATAFEIQFKVAGDLLSTIVEVPLKAGEELFSTIFGSAPENKEGDSSEESGSEARHE
jgi:ferredoxin